MYRPTLTPQQMLTHSEVPGNSGLFVLGFQERHVNFYSQQVRALNLVLALELEGRLPARPAGNRCRVCVIGGGAGGAMAAIALALTGCEVTIFEQQKALLPHPASKSTASGKDRTIHPHLMHWPYSTGHGNDAGLPFMNWKADEIGEVLSKLRHGFTKAKKRIEREKNRQLISEKLSTLVETIERIPPVGPSNWHASFRVGFLEKMLAADGNGNWGKQDKLECDIVILATGFSGEKSYPGLKFESYWNRGLLDSFKGTTGDVLVSGIGDGGIEDAIQLALNKPRAVHKLLPFLFMPDNDATRSPDEDKLHNSVKALKAWLMDIERQAHAVDRNVQSSFLQVNWHKELDFTNPNPDFESVLRKIRTVLTSELKQRPITITLNASEASFHSLRASVVHRLILHCIQRIPDSKVKIEYIRGRLAAKDSWPDEGLYAIQSEDPSKSKEPFYHKAQLLVLRHGPKLGFESIKLVPATIDTAIRELQSRNVLDQTRFPMWPIYGNPKRFTKFRKATHPFVATEYDALADLPNQPFDAQKAKTLPELCCTLPLPCGESIEFVYIPGGEYVLGRNGNAPTPGDKVTLKGFWISRYPITVKQYMTFVKDAHYEWPVKFRDIDMRDRLEYQHKRADAKLIPSDLTPKKLADERDAFIKDFEQHPITDISWIDAMHLCHWAGFSLPTGAQWEAACTGHLTAVTNLENSPHNNDEFSSEYIHYQNTGRRMGTAPVTTYAFARSPFGVVQPLGNVWEICLDSWVEQPKPTEPDPISINDSRHREFRGGSWFDRDQPNPFHRGHNHDRNRNGRDGFRVVWVNPKGTSDKEKAHEERIHGEKTKKIIEFPIVIDSSCSETSKAEDVTYLATPAWRRLHAVKKRQDQDDNRPLHYLSLAELKRKLAQAPIDIVLGSYNINRETEQRCLALSCDAWHLSELTSALVSIGVSKEICTCLADEVVQTNAATKKTTDRLADKIFPEKSTQTIISVGSGSVNAVSELMVNDNVVPGFEQPTTSPVFGQKKFFANPSKSLGYGILVAYEETVNKEPYVRILAAGRSGYATAAAIALLTQLLRHPAGEFDDLSTRLVFNVKGKLNGKDSAAKSLSEWQDFGIPMMETLELEEVIPIKGHSTHELKHWRNLIRDVLNPSGTPTEQAPASFLVIAG